MEPIKEEVESPHSANSSPSIPSTPTHNKSSEN